MARSTIVLAVLGFTGLWFGPAARGADGPQESKGIKGEAGLLSAYFKIWKALGKDELKGVPEAKKELASALKEAAKAAPEGIAGKDRDRRAKSFASAQAAASKLDASDLKKAREGFGVLSSDLRKLIEAFPAEADAYVVWCDMAKKSWLQDSPKVLNPYYGASMAGCGTVVRKPASGAKSKGAGAGDEKPADPHAGHGHGH